MTPQNFRELVFNIADSIGFSVSKLFLGGDHLGPNVWTIEQADSAMEKAKEQVRAYVRAGHSKIHLDATMKCADDGDPDSLHESGIIVERAAILCKVAEEEVKNRSDEFELPVLLSEATYRLPVGLKKEAIQLG